MKLTLPLGSAAVVVLLSSTAVILTPREPTCRLGHEPIAESALAQPLDPVHAARDLADVEREAVRFGQAVARRPLSSDSIDAKEGARTAPMRAVAWCRVTLVTELSRVHQMSAAALLAAGSAGEAQAETERASRADATSSVVSRPSR